VEPRITFTGPLDRVVPAAVRADVLATLREALANVARHAEADNVDVEVALDAAGARLDLRVRDDGSGPGRGPHRGRGVVNMGGRAQRWGGRCVVQAGTGGGTEVHWSVPLPDGPGAP
jgi:signal transduction histidine kinase